MNESAAALGLIATAIAVGGFVMHAGPALAGRDEQDLRRLTVIGGIGGFVVATILILASVLW